MVMKGWSDGWFVKGDEGCDIGGDWFEFEVRRWIAAGKLPRWIEGAREEVVEECGARLSVIEQRKKLQSQQEKENKQNELIK